MADISLKSKWHFMVNELPNRIDPAATYRPRETLRAITAFSAAREAATKRTGSSDLAAKARVTSSAIAPRAGDKDKTRQIKMR